MELLHVITAEAWEKARQSGGHAPPELERDGFLHCCTGEQLDFVLARHFADLPGLIILTFEADDVPAKLRWVSSEPDQAPFPHLYGPIPCDAVRRAASPAI